MMKDFLIAASRGRNPENPSDRTAGSPLEQRLEINTNGICNAITTVSKDNYVLEITKDGEECQSIHSRQTEKLC